MRQGSKVFTYYNACDCTFVRIAEAVLGKVLNYLFNRTNLSTPNKVRLSVVVVACVKLDFSESVSMACNSTLMLIALRYLHIEQHFVTIELAVFSHKFTQSPY